MIIYFFGIRKNYFAKLNPNRFKILERRREGDVSFDAFFCFGECFRQANIASSRNGSRFFSVFDRHGFFVLRTEKSQRRLERFKPHAAFFARIFRHDRAVLFFRYGAKYSARFGDDDSISFADIYEYYCDFSAQRIGSRNAMDILCYRLCGRFIY